LETSLEDLGRDFGEEAIEIGKGVHDVFNEECAEKSFGFAPDLKGHPLRPIGGPCLSKGF
jgi:hypothetical protein